MGARSGNVGALVAILSGLALIAVMFGLTWYEITVPDEIPADPNADLTFNGWDAFDRIDFGLLAVAVISVLAGLVAATRTGDAALFAGAVAAAAGVAALLVLGYRVIDPPTLALNGVVVREEGGVEIGASAGAFLGLVTLAGVAVGGWLCMKESGSSLRDAVSRLERSLGDEPEVEQDPGPPQAPAG